MEQDHSKEPSTIERQCPYCDQTFSTIKEVTKHSNEAHHPYACNICFMRFSEEFKLVDHRRKDHNITNLGANVSAIQSRDPSDQMPGPDPQKLVMVQSPLQR